MTERATLSIRTRGAPPPRALASAFAAHETKQSFGGPARSLGGGGPGLASAFARHGISWLRRTRRSLGGGGSLAPRSGWGPWLALPALLLAPGACHQDLHDQPRYEPLEASRFFDDGRSARPKVEGTIARGQLRLDEHLYDGTVGGEPAETFPFEVTRAVLERGRDRFTIFCRPCHGSLGNGNGIIVQRGFQRPESFHVERLREAPPGYLYDVITNGYGGMYSYASRVPVRDRWAIVAYVRALQLSQHASLADAPAAERRRLEEEP